MNNENNNGLNINPQNPVNPTPNVGINPMDQVIMPVENNTNNNQVNNAGYSATPNNIGVTPQPVQPQVQPNVVQPQPSVQQQPGVTQMAQPASVVQPNMQVQQPQPVQQPVQPQPSVQQPVNLGIPVEPIEYANPNNIGTVPPVNNTPPVNNQDNKKGGKKPLNKTLFVILLIVLLFAVGGGVYWYLNMPKSASVVITPKEVSYSLNDEISTKIEDYATITGTNASNCTLDTSSIDTSKFGDYSFTIKCGNYTKIGVAKVLDNDSPVVGLITVNKKVNEELKADEFIGVCFDSSKCTYTFENEEESKTITSEIGNNKVVKIIVKDENNNSTTVDGKLNVLETGIKTYRTCSSKEQNLTDFNASMTSSQRLAFTDQLSSDGSYSFANFGTQTYTYKFTDQKEYDELYNKMKTDNKITINNVTGVAEFNKEDMTIKIVEDLNINNLITQYTQEKLLSYKTIDNLFVTELGYTCVNK